MISTKSSAGRSCIQVGLWGGGGGPSPPPSPVVDVLAIVFGVQGMSRKSGMMGVDVGCVEVCGSRMRNLVLVFSQYVAWVSR